MATNQLEIHTSTVLDNVDAQLVEFVGEVDAEEYQFAVQYAVLEALSGDPPEDDAIDTFHKFSDEICDAALVALARDTDATTIVVSENDME